MSPGRQQLVDMIQERFLRYVDKSGECWVWTGASKGRKDTLPTWRDYGQIWIVRRTTAHRISYMLFKGEVPAGMVVRHMCHNRVCVRPDHLELGTQKENIWDSQRAGRMSAPPILRGEKSRTAKLTDKKVLAIRAEWRGDERGERVRLAAKYGVAPVTIRDIVYGRTWRHLLPEGSLPGHRRKVLKSLTQQENLFEASRMIIQETA